MELFKLLIFSTCLFLFGTGALFDTLLIYLFLNMAYKSKISYVNTLDPTMFLVNLINIMMHLIVYQFNDFIKIINQTYGGRLLISSYNYLDELVVRVKTLFFHWIVLTPMKYVMSKTMGSLINEDVMKTIKEIKTTNNGQIPVIKKTLVSPDIKLETNQDISNFLDRLLEQNKKTD
jgi:hypothetical protein